MKHIYIIYIAIYIALSSCVSKKTDNIIESKDSKALLKVELSGIDNGQKTDYSQIYSDIEYVTLEHNPLVNIRMISNIEIMRDKSYLIFDMGNRTIARFDSTGAFLNTIGETGHATGEYIFPTSASYDPYSNNVIVWDNKQLLYYSIDGKFQKKLDLDWSSKLIIAINENQLMAFFGYSPSIIDQNKGLGYAYKIIDKQTGSIVEEFWPFTKDEKDPMTGISHCIERYKDRIMCHPTLSTSLFEYSNGDYRKICEIDLPEKSKWAHGDNSKEICESYSSSLASEDCLNGISNIFYSTRYYILNYYWHNHIHASFIDKKTGNVVCRGDYVRNDIDGLPGSLSFLKVIDDKVYCAIDPSEFESAYSSIKEDNSDSNKKKEQLQRFVNSQYPIIQICTLK